MLKLFFLTPLLVVLFSHPTRVHKKTTIAQIESRASYVGGNKGLQKFLTEHFKFPTKTETENCYYNVTITKEGRVANVRKGICEMGGKDSEYNEKSIINLMEIAPEWIPAKKNGSTIEYESSIYVKIYKKKIMVYIN